MLRKGRVRGDKEGRHSNADHDPESTREDPLLT